MCDNVSAYSEFCSAKHITKLYNLNIINKQSTLKPNTQLMLTSNQTKYNMFLLNLIKLICYTSSPFSDPHHTTSANL